MVTSMEVDFLESVSSLGGKSEKAGQRTKKMKIHHKSDLKPRPKGDSGKFGLKLKKKKRRLARKTEPKKNLTKLDLARREARKSRSKSYVKSESMFDNAKKSQKEFKKPKAGKLNFNNIYSNKKAESTKIVDKLNIKKKARLHKKRKRVSNGGELGNPKKKRPKKIRFDSLKSDLDLQTEDNFDIYQNIVKNSKKKSALSENYFKKVKSDAKKPGNVHLLYEQQKSGASSGKLTPKQRKKKIHTREKSSPKVTPNFKKKFESLTNINRVQNALAEAKVTESEIYEISEDNIPNSLRRLTTENQLHANNPNIVGRQPPVTVETRNSIEMDSISDRYISQTDRGMYIENNLSEAPRMLKYEYNAELPALSPASVSRTIEIDQEVHLSAICYMPDEEVFAVGGWNSKLVSFYDSRPSNYFELIMEIETQHIFNLSNLEYLESLKMLFVGDCFSGLSIYR